MLFWRSKRSRRPPGDPESRWPELLAQLREQPGDLMVVTGPEDGGSVCSDWVGAVVSVGGHSDEFPALVEAVEDGLFHPACRHQLIPYRVDDGEAEALFCTKLAMVAMIQRRRKGPAEEGDPDARREEFIALYEDARGAERSDHPADALKHCQAALRLLSMHDIFGANQAEVVRVLKGRMQTILRAHSSGPPRGATVG